MQKITLEPEQLKEYLETLSMWEAMEIQILGERKMVRMPYMMNDAIECYLEFASCIVQGEWIDGIREDIGITLLSGHTRQGVALDQRGENVLTIWYETVSLICQPYQYHVIGHQWRKQKGQENWRRLVHLLCIIHDKVNYLGEDVLLDACNQREEELASLIEFGPITYLSPIDRSIEDWYLETEEGFMAIRKLASEAGDSIFLSLVDAYQNASRRKRERMRVELAMELSHEKHRKIYQLLADKIQTASLFWPERTYDKETQEMIRTLRQEKTGELLERGYFGNYPVFGKNENGIIRRLRCVEEHPFTVLEWDDYTFEIFEIEE